MKTLTLLRHAKSAWDDGVTRDFDRPLNPRGRRAARTVGREMKALGLAFDAVLASPARRVVETIEAVAAEFGPLDVAYEERVYLASLATLLDLIRAADEGAASLLLVGHNPGMERLALALAPAEAGPLGREIAAKNPTASLAQIALPVARWRDAEPGAGSLTRFIRPRDLDPELGPED